jgi:hypothetical protein
MSKDEGGWNSSLSEKPVRSRLRRLVDWNNLTGVKKIHSLCQPSWINSFYCISEAVSLRESCIRENRTCSLSGGRWPARKRATSDPTATNSGKA